MRRDRSPLALPALRPAERLMLAVTLALGLVDLVLMAARGARVHWSAYALVTGVGLALLMLGFFYRRSRRSEALAATLVATASFILFTMVASVFNYLLLPIWRMPIDPVLAQLDAMLGFSWPQFLALVADYPVVCQALRLAYMTSLPQFALIVIVLGLSERTRELHVFMLATVLTCLATLAIWALFPSFGTTTVFNLGAELESRIRPVVGSAYGAELQHLAVHGPALISPTEALGLIAVPSFHTVMALLAICATRTVRWLSPFMIGLNLMVLPGVLVHGGHHLVDVFAGMIVAAGGIVAARAFLQPSVIPAAPATQVRA